MEKRKRILIIGGVAGGASCAARARRMSEDSEIILFERGEEISVANCGFPYYIGGTIPERKSLAVQTPQRMEKRFNIKVQNSTEVVKIIRERKEVLTRNLKTGEERTEPYDVLVLSPGAEPILPDIPGIKSELVFTIRSTSDTDRLKNFLQNRKPERAVVIGGGYIGLEMTEALVNQNLKVTLVELANQVMSTIDPEMAYFLHEHLVAKGVDLRLKNSVREIKEIDKGLLLKLNSGESIETDLVVLGIGVRPEVKLAKEAGLKLGQTGGIMVDQYMRTSDPDIFAVGDAIEVSHFVGDFQTLIPLAGPANRQGRIAGTNIFRNQFLSYKKTQGTAICKVFDLSAACTGLNEKTLKKLGISFEKIYLHPESHADFFPGASLIRLKLLFDPKNGKILGAQAVGKEGVDKRIDVLAVALRANLTVFDLEDLELCYAPMYNSAKDPVNFAGFVASNVIRGDVAQCHAEDVLNIQPNQFLLDVRSRFEFSQGAIPGAVHIRINDLRNQLDKIPQDKEILVYCDTGVRSYLASRILSQRGFRCRNLSGGYVTYLAVKNVLG